MEPESHRCGVVVVGIDANGEEDSSVIALLPCSRSLVVLVLSLSLSVSLLWLPRVVG